MSTTKEQVVDWFDPAIVHEYEEIDDPGVEFNLVIDVSGMSLHIIQELVDGPIRVISHTTFSAETLSLIYDMEAERRNFHNLIASVITNTPGSYTFLDEDDNPCSFDELRSISLEQRIYPDGLSQQQLMDSILAIGCGSQFIIQATDNLREGIKNSQ